MHKELWTFFIENYGGGPLIIYNKDLDIYSSSIISLCLNNNFISKSSKKIIFDVNDDKNKFFDSSLKRDEEISNSINIDKIEFKEIKKNNGNMHCCTENGDGVIVEHIIKGKKYNF